MTQKELHHDWVYAKAIQKSSISAMDQSFEQNKIVKLNKQ